MRLGAVNRIVAALLLLLMAGISCTHGQPLQALASLALLIVFCGTALPLSRLLFADRIVSLVFAFPLGYVIHSVLLSILSRAFGVRPLVLGFDLAIGAAVFLVMRRKMGKPATSFDPEDTFLLLLWLLMTVLLTAPAFVNVGALTPSGFAYRAYFNADFFRNMAVSGSLVYTGVPPLNPYFSGTVLHYYWFFHIVPAVWEKVFPSWRLDLILVQFSLAGVLMFVGSLFVTIRSFVSQRKTMLLLYPLFALGGSYKGLYILQQLRQKHQSWRAFTELNVDGILRWNWDAPQIDTLYRALLYAPQHLIPLAVVLMALYFRTSIAKDDSAPRWSRLLLIVFLAFASLGFSLFVGAILVVGVCLDLFLRFIRRPRKAVVNLAIPAACGLFFLALYHLVFRMFEAGATPVLFRMDPAIARHFFMYLLLNWGALGIVGVAGVLWRSSRLPVRPLLFFLLLCVFLILFVEILLPGLSDISLKMGHFSHVVLLCFAAGLLDRLLSVNPQRFPRILLGLLVLALPASVTWLMDAYNCRDISNKKFTTYVSDDDHAQFEWMSRNLPHRATVQNFSLDYYGLVRDFVSTAPPFAQRPVYLGDQIFSRIFQIPDAEMEQRKKMMRLLFRERDPQRIRALAHHAGIHYFYVETKDTERLSEIENRLASPYFSPLFQSGNSILFRVNP